MRRLLAVSWEMPPMYGPRAAQVSALLAELPALGWAPTVVCLAPRRGGPHWRLDDAPMPPSSLECLRVPSPEEWLAVRAAQRFLPALRERPDPQRVWIPRASRAAIDAAGAKRFAAVITFAQPWSDHLVGLSVQRATGLPWVAHFSDPWAASPYATATQRAAWRPLEAQVIDRATALVFVTRETADLTLAPYAPELRTKVAVVPHGFDPRKPVPPGPTAAAGQARLRLAYTGRFYTGLRTPLPLLRAIATLDRADADALDIRFVGPHVEEFRRDALAHGVDASVTFTGRVPASDAAIEAAGADVLLVIDAPSDTPSVFLPSKLVDYLAFRKPILGLTPTRGASAELLARLDCPIAPPDDVEGIARALRDLIDRWRRGRLEVSPSFDRVAAEFDIRCTARQLYDVLTRACA